MKFSTTDAKNDFLYSTVTEEISEQVTESYEEFIFETIRPYCENVVNMKISKRELEQALLKYYGKNDLGVDCISRESVLNLFNKSDGYSWEMGLLKRKIEKMPSVTPQEPKTGHWIYQTSDDYLGELNGYYECSECGRTVGDTVGDIYTEYPYCHCGAKMVEPQESEEE